MTNEQFAFQMSPFEEISRVQTLFGTGLDAVETEVLSDSSLAEVMGCGVLDYLGVGFLRAVSAQQNQGYFDPAWIDRPNFEMIRREIPGPTLRAVFYHHFAVDFPGFRAMAESVPGHRFRPCAATSSTPWSRVPSLGWSTVGTWHPSPPTSSRS